MKTPQKLDFNSTIYEQMSLEMNAKYGVIEAYQQNFHKSIYSAFKLPNTLPMYNKKKPLTFPFLLKRSI
jgi:hypothetical protein